MMRKTYVYRIAFLTMFWVCAAAFITTYDASVLNFSSPVPDRTYDYATTLLTVVGVTFLAGGGLALFEVLVFSRRLRRLPFGRMILLKTAFYLINMFVFISLAIILIVSFETGLAVTHARVIGDYLHYVTGHRFLLTMLYWGLVNLMALFCLQVSESFGQGVLFNFLLGKYHRPRQELRIFMFMDLKSSTTHAETLGHLRYSRLIQDCFSDLTGVVLHRQAQIYQYVGDEVVLTWEPDRGTAGGNCVGAFYDYRRAIHQKREYYLKEYGLLPEFKAAMNYGPVMVAEVGELKKELAYHGDVLNTTARIEEKCSELNRDLLVSEAMKETLRNGNEYQFHFVDTVILRGKSESVNIYHATPAQSLKEEPPSERSFSGNE